MILPDKAVLRASQWCYSGIWRVLTQWFRVPEQPPTLAGAHDQHINSFRPSEGYLRYLKLMFWIGLTLFDGALFVGWLILLFTFPLVGIILTLPIWFIMIVPDIIAYIAIHLRYDTTWYVLSDRSMRIRRGIWQIHETTITYENIQNVLLRQGPVERYFGFANVIVETAGGGGSTGEHGNSFGHTGLLEGISNAEEVKQLIMSKWQQSRSAGLGDEPLEHLPVDSNMRHRTGAGFSPAQVELLEEIGELAQQLAQSKAIRNE